MQYFKAKPMMEKDMAMWVVCHAIGEDRYLIDQMEHTEDGWPVRFEVGGVELDFNRVCDEIGKQFDDAVARKAQELLDAKYDDIIGEIYDIQERIKAQKGKFKYDWEE